MTSSISSYSQAPDLFDPIGSAAGAQAASPPSVTGSPAGAAAPSGEAVTLTPDAQASTELLEAARSAEGVDYQAVQSLKAEIVSGTYQVPSKSLAASIVAAFSDTRA